MFDYYVLSLVLSGLAAAVSLMVAAGFFRAARDAGKEPVGWALAGWGTFVAAGVVAGKLLYLAAWLWDRGLERRDGVALGDIFHTSWFLEAVPAVFSPDPERLLMLLCALKLAMIPLGLLAADMTARAAGLKERAGFDHQAKTISFLGAAAVLGLLVWATVPATLADEEVKPVGQLLFPDLRREAVAAIEIVKFNEPKATQHDLDIRKVSPANVAKELKLDPPADPDGDQPRWFVASHGYYPVEAKGLSEQEKEELLGKDEDKTKKDDEEADEKKTDDEAKRLREEAQQRAESLQHKSQLARALGGLMGLRIEDEIEGTAADHAHYGLLDPKSRKGGSQGCGTRVALKDAGGETLLAMIVGYSVPNRPEMRFVRRADDDRVYVAKIDPKELPVRFAAWIEPNLLQLEVARARGLDLTDFGFSRNAVRTNRALSLASDDGSAWRLVSAAALQEGRLNPQTVPEGKEIDSMKVRDVVNAMYDVEIIDVFRKPRLLSRVLRGQRPPEDAMESLAEELADHGFYLGDNLYPHDGEIHCQMDDGVRYVLKFGSVAPTKEPAAKEVDEWLPKQVAGQPEKPKDARTQVVEALRTEWKVPHDRAIDDKTKLVDLVPAEEDDDLVPPGEKTEKDKEKARADRIADLRRAIDRQLDVEIPAETFEKAATVAQLVETAEAAVKESKKTRYLFVMVDLNLPVAEEYAKKEVAKGKPPKAKKDEPAGEDKEKDAETEKDKPAEADAEKKDESDKPKPAEADKEKAADADKKKPAEAKEEETDDAEDAAAVQEIVDRSRQRATKLNARFADWYYVVSDKSYRKLHVQLDDILRDKPSEKPATGDGDDRDHGPDDGHDHGAAKTPPKPADPLGEFRDLKRAGP